jgi:uncharacterized protein YjbI with pentapeptide repeats
VGVLAVSITAALLLYRLAAKTLRGEWIPSLSWKEKVKSLPAYQHASLTLGILGLCFLTFWTLSTWAMEGFPPHAPINSWEDLSTSPPKTIPYEWHDGPILLPRLFDYLGYRTYANLEEADISTKPPTWTGLEEKLQDEIPLVKGAKLKRANLQNAKMVRAFLINADLRGANLQQADLSLANLQQADLSLANLQEAALVRANLQEAALVEANLHEAALSGATLHKASMRFANLQQANLSLANLQQADLSLANLQQADLGGAYLQQANLGGAYLTDVKNLIQAQLDQACVDEHTKLPEGLTRPKPCPEKEVSKR